MHRFIRKMPALIVLGLGLVLVGWGPYSLVANMQPPQPANGGQVHFLCPPNLAEWLGLGSDQDWHQSAAAVLVGGVAVSLAWVSLRQEAKAQ